MKKLLLNTFARILELQAQRLLKKKNPKVIAITGSFGKTSTKLAIAKVLETKLGVLYMEGNYNNQLGMPLSIFGRTPPKRAKNLLAWGLIFIKNELTIHGRYPYKIVVLEVGADRPGDIKRFTRYLKPDLAVLTAVAPVHTELFGTIEKVLEEKWALAVAAKRVLINGHDRRLVEKAASVSLPVRTYGITRGDYYASDLAFNNEKLSWGFKLNTPEQNFKAQAAVVGRQSLYPLVAAGAVATMFHIPPKTIKESLAAWQQPAGRMKPLSGKKGSLIIDDSYNSSTAAATAALDALYQFEGRKIAILGSMNELGEYERSGHEKVGKHARNVDLLVTIGNTAKEHLAAAAIQAGLDKEKVQIFISPVDAGKYVAEQLKKGDTVLAKGSQNGVFAEEAVKLLLKDKSDSTQLVRQSRRWLEIKRAQFPDIE